MTKNDNLPAWDLSDLYYSLRLCSYTMKIYMVTVANGLSMEMYLMQELNVVVRLCTLTGFRLLAKDM